MLQIARKYGISLATVKRDRNRPGFPPPLAHFNAPKRFRYRDIVRFYTQIDGELAMK
jgi:hypothetical protein